jgi:AI-2 transport protein TqsA
MKIYQIFLFTVAFAAFIYITILAQSILLPFVLALFLTFTLMPVVQFLVKRKVPLFVASVLSLLVVVLFITIIGYLLSYSVRSINQRIPFYVEQFRNIFLASRFFLEDKGVQIHFSDIESMLDPKEIAGMVTTLFKSTFRFVQYGALVFFMTFFMLLEMNRFKQKLTQLFAESSYGLFIENIGWQIQRYLFFKTMISLGTGTIVYIFLKILNVDFPLIWALLTFFLNYIPSVGSILASVPPVLVALVQFDNPIKPVATVLLGLVAIQATIGTYLDPRIMGESLNLSPMIVFLSMVFWGFVWGPMGMLVGVPLTVCLKVVLQQSVIFSKYATILEK